MTTQSSSINKMRVFLLFLFPFVLFVFLASTSADDQIPKETSLMTKRLPDMPGKEGLVETVVFSPGEIVPAHRHNADVFAYVLEGSIVTQLKGGSPQTVHAGEVFYESLTRTSQVTTPVRRNPRSFSCSM